MDIKHVTQILNGEIHVSDNGDTIHFGSDQELADLVVALIEQGYAFTDAPAGWPPAAIVQGLKERGMVHRSFIAITWSGPNDYRTYEVA